MDSPANPLPPFEPLKQPLPHEETVANPQAPILPGDSATTKAEKIERHGQPAAEQNGDDFFESPKKRMKTQHETAAGEEHPGRQKGVAPIKKEYLIEVTHKGEEGAQYDDDAAEASGKAPAEKADGKGGKKAKGGQNTNRHFGHSRDEIQLCKSRAFVNELAPNTCQYGDKCKFEHDIRKYLDEGKREDLQTLGGVCHVFQAKGKCSAGWRCRFASSHSFEIRREDGRRELVLVQNDDQTTHNEAPNGDHNADQDDDNFGDAVNVVDSVDKINLRKKKFPLPKSDEYIKWIDRYLSREEERYAAKKRDDKDKEGEDDKEAKAEQRANDVDPPPRPSEKRRIYYGPETPVLAPLTTQGNLPFRRLCVELGAQVTWSEMAMGMPLIQGEKGEWALMKAHDSELSSPAYYPKNPVQGYDNSKDIRFGAQIAGNKPWLALKTTEVLTKLCPRLRAIDLNCGCPIDLVFRQGAGSALMDSQGKLEKMLRGMNTVSGEVPITVKIRMGTKDKFPNADKLCQRLIMGSDEAREADLGPAGVAAITLHGRSRQQRYTRSADWEYIAECASLIKNMKAEQAAVTDTIREPDARDLSSSSSSSNDGLPYFCGNGDILSHVDYNTHIAHSGVDSCMVGRGALVKPWIFEEISSNQYLDKSASERLGYIERFCRNGLEYWGSDEIGVGTTRRFLLEWLSFSCRYVPIGLLEYLPPKFGDRPPAFRGRNELETLLSSGNYKDWFKISEMFLGKAHKDFVFQPKHKSNSYEIEAEG